MFLGEFRDISSEGFLALWYQKTSPEEHFLRKIYVDHVESWAQSCRYERDPKYAIYALH